MLVTFIALLQLFSFVGLYILIGFIYVYIKYKDVRFHVNNWPLPLLQWYAKSMYSVRERLANRRKPKDSSSTNQ